MSGRSEGPTPEAWSRLQDLFTAALDVPAERRTAWVHATVGDRRERDELLGLLRAHEEGGHFDSVSAGISSLGATEERNAGETDALPGEIAGYTVESLLGEGGTARVYAAHRSSDPSAGRVAVKVLRTSTDNERVRRRFLAEREILAGLAHPGIAGFVEAGFTRSGTPYLVTDFVDGRPIHAHCDGLDLDPDARVRLFLGVCDAVEAAHAAGVVHRDLKPSNVFVDRDGHVRLLDFGIAKVLEGAVFPHLHRDTSAGVRVLTFQYASPEQLSGGRISPASDVYQLGLLLHRLLAGRLPMMATKLTQGSARDAGADELGVVGVDIILDRALQPGAADRYDDAGDMKRALEAVLEAPGRRSRWRPHLPWS